MAVLVVIVLSVVCATLLAVIVSERMARDELVSQAVKTETGELEIELAAAKIALKNIEELAAAQSRELRLKSAKIIKLQLTLGGSMESL